jgi:hypothetical protein
MMRRRPKLAGRGAHENLAEGATMQLSFETLGNATLVFREDGKPLLATDPWLTGTCYYGSWALDRPLSQDELQSMLDAEFLWISHGHPDHFHIPSLKLLPKGKRILLPDHYSQGIRDYLTAQGFVVEVMEYRKWRVLSPQLRCMCLDNENQDAILLVEFGNSLIVNLNDSPLCGDGRFIRRLVKSYERSRTYMAALCSNDADMFNLVDADDKRIIDTPEHRKPGMVWQLSRTAAQLGVGNYVASASQHLYVRRDSVWANPYRVGWNDVVWHWTHPEIRIIEPFVVVDLATGEYRRKHPAQTSDTSQITDLTDADDWNDRLEPAEWEKLFGFFQRIEILRPYLDYVEFTIGGETRRIKLNPRGERGIAFRTPRQSLMRCLRFGYFDDLLIGNFMRTELRNVTLYPHFSPIVAKLAGSSGVRTHAEWRRFKWRYFRRNPVGYVEWRLAELREQVIERLRHTADRLGIKPPLKRLYRRMLGDPAG